MTRILRDDDVRRCLTPEMAVDAVSKGMIGAADAARETAARSILPLREHGWLRIMSGTLASEDVMGFKAFHLVPGVGVRYLCALYRLSTGEPLALVDANDLTVARTSAAAASAARRCFGTGPVSVGIIGSGRLASDGLRVLASAVNIGEARAYSPRRERREAYAAELGPSLGFPLEAAMSAREAVRGADMVLCATATGGHVALHDDDLDAHRFISSVGSTLPAQRELDEHIITGAAHVVIDTWDALAESGDLIAASRAGLPRERLETLAAYLTGTSPPRPGLTVYKSIGSAEQDLALATALWRRAVDLGVGEETAPVEALAGQPDVAGKPSPQTGNLP